MASGEKTQKNRWLRAWLGMWVGGCDGLWRGAGGGFRGWEAVGGFGG